MRIVITLLLLSVTASAAGIHRDEGLFVAYQQRLADRRTEALDIRRMNMLRKRYPVRSAAEISKRRTYQFANCHPSRADSLRPVSATGQRVRHSAGKSVGGSVMGEVPCYKLLRRSLPADYLS